MSGLRQSFYEALEPTAHPEGLSWTNRVLIVLILVAATATVLETEPSIINGRLHLFFLVELATGLAFTAEYLARMWIVPDNPLYQGRRFARLRYALTPAALIDLAAILPTLMALQSGSGALLLRFFRVLRILRLAKLGRMSRAWSNLVESVSERRHELFLTISLAMIVLLIASTLMYWAEAAAQPEKFGSIPRAMWWCIVTLTTVGYGDVYPITVLGKMLSGFVALAGIGLIAMPAGIIAAAFSDVVQRHRAAAAEAARLEAVEALADEQVDEKETERRLAIAERKLELAEKGTALVDTTGRKL